MKIRLFAALAAVALACSATRLSGEGPAPAAVFGSGSEESGWKPSTNLPPGAEYLLIREDPATHGVQALARFPSGYAVGPHSHGYDETLVILSGKLELKADGASRVLSAGDYAVLPANLPHEMKAQGWRGVRLIVTVSGPYDLKKTP